ncbi:hypothetical protein [Streptomyces avicenniae]|uniref:hypothetical protein n=1 Tax=Streptomyces avicenniae TaxID=500153 RepID=UPI00069B813F|nr:hypothetical protein [Streptomyces avicenniae]
MDVPPADATPPDHAERERLLLGGPLGRHLLLTFLDSPDEDWAGEDSAAETLFAALGLSRAPGTGRLAYDMLDNTFREIMPLEGRRARDVPAEEVRAVLRERVARGAWHRLSELDEENGLLKLADVSFLFGFRSGDPELWSLSALAAEELRPLAAALAASPAAETWWSPVARGDQRRLVATGSGPGSAPRGGIGAAVRRSMAEARAQHLARLPHRPPPGHRIGAFWWSAPDFAHGTWTTGGRADVPSIEFVRYVDSGVPAAGTKVRVDRLEIDPAARVAEIRGPADWQALVARFPRDVTGTHDGEWRAWTGREGPWYLPDWEALAAHYDGVHVTVGACLAAFGLALPVEDGWTVLAGWLPDATAWVRDTATAARTLGHWRGDPDSVEDWADVRAHWTPDASAR